jgi:galactofuranosylgalactofuranosylrhamnosyl-N-acetylglucosaminyl-diphospho-decaprenol beta-1,5/1,6-galactofuranosyltransferase
MATLLQKICEPLDDKPLELFFLTGGDDDTIKVSTNTYFNRFAAGQWAAVKALKNVNIDITSNFEGSLDILGLSHEGVFIILSSNVGYGTKITSTFQPQGLISVWVDFYSSKPIDLKNIEIEYHISKSDYEEHSSSIVITTYNKASYVESNLNRLTASLDQNLISNIIVINQGEEIVKLNLCDSLKVISQPNLGGSGGFARGIYEFQKTSSQGIVLMDDDIVFIPEVIYRILRFASLSKNSFAVSTQILNLYMPSVVWADSEVIDMKQLWSSPHGRRQFHANDNPFLGETGNMVAWWCGYFPRELIDKLGLPLPIFIHWDDVEYSLRAQAIKNFQVKTIFGFGVWHEPFDSKSRWGWISYFDMRNALIGSAIHGGTFFYSYKKVIKTLYVSALTNRYQANASIRAGIQDFNHGVNCLDGNQRVRALEVFESFPASDSNVSDQRVELKSIQITRPYLTIAGHILRSFTCRKTKVWHAYTPQNYQPVSALSKTQSTLIYSPYGGISEIRNWDLEAATRTYIKSLVIILIFPFRWTKAKKLWKLNHPKIISVDAWLIKWGIYQ